MYFGKHEIVILPVLPDKQANFRSVDFLCLMNLPEPIRTGDSIYSGIGAKMGWSATTSARVAKRSRPWRRAVSKIEIRLA